ncbi:MAG TPA: efflux RND transporter periplasmic adaptor subunit [Chthoniobacterales bacterium]
MIARFIIVIVLFVLFVGGLVYRQVSMIKAQQAMKFELPPDTVTTVVATEEEWSPTLSAVGSLKPVKGVEVSTDLSGIVSNIGFESGKPVKQGDLLVQLDIVQEEAALRSAQARADLANLNRNRFQDLVAKNSASKSDLDSAVAEFRQAQAAVDEQKALINRKTLRAPFDGTAGIRKVNVGQFVNPGTPIVDVTALDPLYVNFSLPQQHVTSLAPGQSVEVTVEGAHTDVFVGQITALNSIVDAATRNIEVQATLRNPEGKLLPGMFAKVNVKLPEVTKIVAIPGSSISYAPYGDSVFVVVDGKTMDGKSARVVENRPVKLGVSRGDQVAVVSGLKSGDEVVTSGAFKLRPGGAVVVNNKKVPSNDPAPKPADS